MFPGIQYIVRMKVYVSLLRSINVGGKNKIRMADLKKTYTSIGLENVETHIQSGNVVFSSTFDDPSKSEEVIESAIRSAYSIETVALVRIIEEYNKIVQENPFIQKDDDNTDGMYVTFLRQTPDPKDLPALSQLDSSSDRFEVMERVIYLALQAGYSKTKLQNSVIEKKLNVPATTRNWKTVLKLAELADSIR